MASSASDAGHSEKDIREKLIKTGAVDVMLAIGSNFFYTRSLPCTLWFFDRAKEQDKERSQKILMLDARKIYHVVNQKIHDFSPEQLQNLICVVQLYRGNSGKFHQTVKAYLETSAQNAIETATILQNLMAATEKLQKQIEGFVSQLEIEGIEKSSFHQPNTSDTDLLSQLTQLITDCHTATADMVIMESIATQCKHLRKPLDKMLKALYADIATGVKDHQLNKNKDWNALNVKNQLNNIKEYQALLCGNPDEEEPGLLHDMEYFWKQAHWLINRFPDGIYTDIEGLCKVVTLEEVAAKDYSLSPGRYVGVDAGTDDDFDYEERLREIHLELAGLNEEAEQLVKAISDNYKELL
jgi:type I restriction enzyme M protein